MDSLDVMFILSKIKKQLTKTNICFILIENKCLRFGRKKNETKGKKQIILSIVDLRLILYG